MRGKRRWLLALVALALLWQLAPERPQSPVQGATRGDWNEASFWHEPWGRSSVHKGIDIFARRGTPVLAPTYGLILFSGEIAVGGKVVLALGPAWRLHYLAHLQEIAVSAGRPVATGMVLGSVGDSGNAKGTPPHLHYSVVSILPRPWRADDASQGWKKMFYLDPAEFLGIR